MPRPVLTDLTPAQRDAVIHPSGPMLVLAGAGAGKTRVLCRRLAWLVSEGADPGDILALTFSAKAAAELRERAEDMIPDSHETLRVTTFHSYALDLVRSLGTDRDLAPVLRPVGTEERVLVLLERLALARPGVAVAVNLKVIARSTWGAAPLHEGDAVEVIQAVGGG